MAKKQEVQKNKPKPRFKAGQTAWIVLIAKGEGVIASEEAKVKSVRQGKVWVDAMIHGDGPFDAVTGRYLPNKSVSYTRKLISENPDTNKSKPRFKVGQTVWVQVGLLSSGTCYYIERKVKSVRQGKVLVGSHAYRGPYDAKNGKCYRWIYDGYSCPTKILSKKPEA